MQFVNCFLVGGATGEAEVVKRERDDEKEKSGQFSERHPGTTKRV